MLRLLDVSVWLQEDRDVDHEDHEHHEHLLTALQCGSGSGGAGLSLQIEKVGSFSFVGSRGEITSE